MDNQPNQHPQSSNNFYQNMLLPKSGLAIAGFVLGVVAILGSWIPILNNLAFPLAILALIFGVIGLVGVVRGKKSGKGLAIAAIVVSIIGIVVVLATQSMYSAALDEASNQLEVMDGSATEELLQTAVDVEIGQFSADESSGYPETELPVTVTNKADETHSYTIQLEAVNADGSRISDEYIYANDLAAGQSEDFESFTYVSPDDLEAYQKATFNIVSVSQY